MQTQSSSQGSTASTAGYNNPLRGISNLVPERIDQGVDYSGTGPIYAIGNGTIDKVSSDWYTPKNGLPEPYLAYTLTSGPAKGLEVYVAECINHYVSSIGQSVNSNTVIAQMYDCGSGIETGWGNPNSNDESMAYNCWNNAPPVGTPPNQIKLSSTFGINFSQFLQSLGAPGGLVQGSSAVCTLPQGWPAW